LLMISVAFWLGVAVWLANTPEIVCDKPVPTLNEVLK